MATRKEYVDHIARSFQLLGHRPRPTRARRPTRSWRIETALARSSYTNVQRRDPNANYHKMAGGGPRAARRPSFDWATYLAKRGGPSFDSLNVAQVTFFPGLDTLITGTPLAAWQAYLRWRVVEDAAPTLSSPFVQEDFRFARVLSGATEMQPRWKRCLRATDGGLGDLLGKVYVPAALPARGQGARAADGAQPRGRAGRPADRRSSG